MNILGIDPGTRVCGYAIVDARPPAMPKYVACGVFIPTSDEARDRSWEMANELDNGELP